MTTDDPREASHFAELRSMMLDMMQDQILSSLDTILLLLLPLSTFALGITPWLLTSLHFLVPWTLSFALASLVPLGILVIAKLKGNVQSRILSWIMFIVLVSSVAGLFALIAILGMLGRLPIESRPNFVPLFIIGHLTLSYGLSYPQVRRLKHLLLRRIYWKSSEIQRMFSSYETIHRYLSPITKRDGMFGTLVGLVLLLLFVRYGVVDFPTQWEAAFNAILILPFVVITSEIVWSKLGSRLMKSKPPHLSESSKQQASGWIEEGRPWATIAGVAIWMTFFMALTLALTGIAFIGIRFYSVP